MNKKNIILGLLVSSTLSCFAQNKQSLPFSIESLDKVMSGNTSKALDKYVYFLYDVDRDGRKELFVKEKVKDYNTYYGFVIKDNKEVELVLERSSGGSEDFGYTSDGYLWHYEEHTGGQSQYTSNFKLKNSKVVSSTHMSVDVPSDMNEDSEISTEYQVYQNGKLISKKEADYNKYNPKGTQTSLYNIEGWKDFPSSEIEKLKKLKATQPITQEIVGDLNKDGIVDKIVIETPRNKANIVVRESDGYEYNFNQPIMYVYFSDGKDYKLFKKYSNVIPHPEEEDECVDLQVTISEKGVLKISYSLFYSMGSYGSSDHSYLYRYQDGDFCLIGEEHTESERNTGDYENVSINHLTHKKQVKTGNNFEDGKKPTEKWLSIPNKPLEKLGAKNLKE